MQKQLSEGPNIGQTSLELAFLQATRSLATRHKLTGFLTVFGGIKHQNLILR